MNGNSAVTVEIKMSSKHGKVYRVDSNGVVEIVRDRSSTYDPAPRYRAERAERITAPAVKRKAPILDRLYWAYGSNLNVAAMKVRCPGAKKLKALTLENGALVFRYVADVVYSEGSEVPGGLWRISEAHERTLDTYEGVANRLYLKRYMSVPVDGEEQRCLYYQMRMSSGIMPPAEGYFNTIRQGYADFGLDEHFLLAAVHDAHEHKAPTHYLRSRRDRKGERLVKLPEFDLDTWETY